MRLNSLIQLDKKRCCFCLRDGPTANDDHRLTNQLEHTFREGLKALDKDDGLRHFAGFCFYGEHVTTAVGFFNLALPRKGPCIEHGLVLSESSLPFVDCFGLCVRFEAPQLTLARHLNNGEWNKKIALRQIGQAPCRMGKYKACEFQ